MQLLPPLSDRPGLMWRQGQYIPRRQGFVSTSVNVTCRHGHVMKRGFIVFAGEFAMSCHHEIHRGMRCGEMVFVMFGFAKRYFRADVTEPEVIEIQRRGWNADQILDYFGASYIPPVEPPREAVG